MKTLEKGLRGEARLTVSQEFTARNMGSGELEVLATPAMTALMEKAAAESVKPALDESESSVGTVINVKHLSATPAGMTVRAESELLEVDGRRLLFAVRAYDEAGMIGEGEHERFVIAKEKFMSKANGKLKG